MIDYRRLMDATWDALYSSPLRRQAIAADLPATEASLLHRALTEGLEQDALRRRSRISIDLLECFPITFRVFYGLGGASGLNEMLESNAWRERDWRFGEAFPSRQSAAEAFYQFFGDDVSSHVPERAQWVCEAFYYEAALLGLGPEKRSVTRDPSLLQLHGDAWIAECSFDVDEVVEELIERSHKVPWSEAALLVKPRPRRYATVVLTERDNAKRYRLVDEAVDSLRWAWSADAEVPPAPEKNRAVLDAAAAGLLL